MSFLVILLPHFLWLYGSILIARDGFFRSVLTTFCIFDEIWEDCLSTENSNACNGIENLVRKALANFEENILLVAFDEVERKALTYLRTNFS